jgi:hypothetical protein
MFKFYMLLAIVIKMNLRSMSDLRICILSSNPELFR